MPYGQIEVGEHQPFDADTETVEVEVETGAIVFEGVSADDQAPNIDLVGPNDYYEHFEVSGGADELHTVDGLTPGVYSVAATDDGYQIAHSLVEVQPGQAILVRVILDQPAQDYQYGAYADDPAFTGTYPANSYDVQTQTAAGQNFAQITVDTNDEDARFIVTGPDNYFQEFNGAFTATDLQPGVYNIAGTAPNSQIATSKVEVDVETTTVMVPTFVATADAEEIGAGDVAGGGGEGEQGQPKEQQPEQREQQEQQDGAGQEGQQQDAEQPAQPEQPETEQPETEQPETEQPETEQTQPEQPEQDQQQEGQDQQN